MVYQMIPQAYDVDENHGETTNCAMHLWGYFKHVATPQEKETYRNVLVAYQKTEITQKELLDFFNKLLQCYPNDYLKQSSILNGKGIKDEIMA